MQQLAQTSGSHSHGRSDFGHEVFDSPRLHSVEVANGFQTPPRPSAIPSTPRAPRRHKPPPLLMSLEANDLMKVRACLSADPLVATTPFWDHSVEPSLCAAVRLRCDTSILKALLDSDVDPEAVDSHGHTPLMIAALLCSEIPEPDLLSLPFSDFPQLPAATEDRLRTARAAAGVLMERVVGPCSTDLIPDTCEATKKRRTSRFV